MAINGNIAVVAINVMSCGVDNNNGANVILNNIKEHIQEQHDEIRGNNIYNIRIL